MKSGFTLIEILVTMAVLAVIGTILVVIFTNTLKGSNKSQVLAVIKQNGQAILEEMDKTVRDADNIICPFLPSPSPSASPGSISASSDTLVIVKNGCYTRYRFVAPSPNPNPTQNGQIQQDNPQPDPATPCIQNSPTPAPRTTQAFINAVCASSDPMDSLNKRILTDTNTQSGVSVNSGALFTRNRQSGFKDGLTVSFTLSPGIHAPAVVAGQIDPVTFQTTVQVR